ncbi:MAG: hypothetical protein AAF530_07330 [Pseudomonadota bacterium]
MAQYISEFPITDAAAWKFHPYKKSAVILESPDGESPEWLFQLLMLEFEMTYADFFGAIAQFGPWIWEIDLTASNLSVLQRNQGGLFERMQEYYDDGLLSFGAIRYGVYSMYVCDPDSEHRSLLDRVDRFWDLQANLGQ